MLIGLCTMKGESIKVDVPEDAIIADLKDTLVRQYGFVSTVAIKNGTRATKDDVRVSTFPMGSLIVVGNRQAIVQEESDFEDEAPKRKKAPKAKARKGKQPVQRSASSDSSSRSDSDRDSTPEKRKPKKKKGPKAPPVPPPAPIPVVDPNEVKRKLAEVRKQKLLQQQQQEQAAREARGEVEIEAEDTPEPTTAATASASAPAPKGGNRQTLSAAQLRQIQKAAAEAAATEVTIKAIIPALNDRLVEISARDDMLVSDFLKKLASEVPATIGCKILFFGKAVDVNQTLRAVPLKDQAEIMVASGPFLNETMMTMYLANRCIRQVNEYIEVAGGVKAASKGQRNYWNEMLMKSLSNLDLLVGVEGELRTQRKEYVKTITAIQDSLAF